MFLRSYKVGRRNVIIYFRPLMKSCQNSRARTRDTKAPDGDPNTLKNVKKIV